MAILEHTVNNIRGHDTDMLIQQALVKNGNKLLNISPKVRTPTTQHTKEDDFCPFRLIHSTITMGS